MARGDNVQTQIKQLSLRLEHALQERRNLVAQLTMSRQRAERKLSARKRHVDEDMDTTSPTMASFPRKKRMTSDNRKAQPSTQDFLFTEGCRSGDDSDTSSMDADFDTRRREMSPELAATEGLLLLAAKR
eukprot:m.331931 g.331931  ORF g.331931 m.331931 type:complete len:130 (-) comp16820_c0_seq1:267-656(-)